MYSLGAPIDVIIDDYVPGSMWGAATKFVQITDDNELWVVFLEKAFAKMHGNYPAIEGGWPTDSAYTFLGTLGHDSYHPYETDESLWQ